MKHRPSTRTRRSERRPRLKVIAAALTMALATSLAATAVSPEPAAASAYSCSGYGYLGWSQFCADTQGSGTYVRSVGAGFSAPVAWMGWLTNTRVKVEFIDSAGRVYRTLLSSVQSGGSAVGAWKWTLNTNVRAGSVKYTLLSNGVEIASRSHRIG